MESPDAVFFSGMPTNNADAAPNVVHIEGNEGSKQKNRSGTAELKMRGK